jgi:hypothetical protein
LAFIAPFERGCNRNPSKVWILGPLKKADHCLHERR